MDIIGEWLCKSTVQVSILILLVMAVKLIVRNRLSARWQYWLWLVVLVRMVMPWVPQSSVSVFNLLPDGSAVESQQVMTEEKYVPIVATDTVAPAVIEPVETIAHTPVTPAKVVETEIAESVSAEVNPPAPLPKFDWPRLAWFVWLGGVIVLAVQVFVSNFRFWRQVKGLRPVTDQGLLDLLEDCKGQMGIGTIVGVVVTDSVKSPALFGFLRPRLLLPTGMAEKLSVEQMRHVFLHELAHLKRCDIYVSWITAIVQVVHWFNPLVWFAFYQMRADREMACDSLALSMMGQDKPSDYGRTIVSMLENYSQKQYVPAMAGILEERSQLKRRITMIAGFKKNSYRWSPLAIVLLVALGCIGIGDAKRNADMVADDNVRSDSFIRTLGNGVTVELLGLYDFLDSSQCWTPQGRLLDEMLPFHEQEGRYACTDDQSGYEFLVRIDGIEEGTKIKARMKTVPNGNVYSAQMQNSMPGKDIYNLYSLWMVLDRTLTNCDLEVEVASDKWVTAATAEPGSKSLMMKNTDGFKDAITLAPLAEAEGRTVVSFSHSITDSDVRIIAIDTDGKEHTHPFQDNRPGMFARNFKNGSSVTYLFDLPLKRVDSIKLQTRKYSKITFKNVSLKPKQQPQVNAGSDERGDDDQGSAKEDGSDSKPQSKEDKPLAAWQTVWASYKVNPDIATQGSTDITDYGTISFGNAYQKDDAAFVEVTDTIDRSLYEVRIVAIGTDESTHLQNGGSSSGFENIKQATVCFDIPLKDIKVFHVQIRPAKDTLLHPSVITDVLIDNPREATISNSGVKVNVVKGKGELGVAIRKIPNHEGSVFYKKFTEQYLLELVSKCYGEDITSAL